MGYESTIDAIRLGLSIQDMRSRIASQNVANANVPDARALRLDFSAAEAALRDGMGQADEVAGDGIDFVGLASRLRSQSPHRSNEVIQVDHEISEMATATITYQSLAEALSRQFGLMRLAITGRN